MAGQILSVDPDLPASTQTVTLGDVQYRLRLTWRPRLRAWYADLYELDGTALWLGQRVSPRWALNLGLEPDGAPAGLLLVRGPDSYRRGDLGGSLKLVFYADADLPAPTSTDLAISVSV